MKLASILTLSALAAFFGALDAFAQTTIPDFPTEAKKRLDHHIGAWDIKMEFLNRNGEVVRTTSGRDTARYIIDDRVVELTTVMSEQGPPSKAWMFYNAQAGEFYLTSVDSKGDLWILSGGLDEYILTSEPKIMRNGREMIIRFTHSEIKDDSFEAVMESSIDGGQSWWMRYRQHISRSKSPDSD